MATSDLSLSGLASGFDWKSFVDQMVSVERSPQTALLTNQSKLNTKNNAYGTIKSLMTTLQSKLAALKDPTLYDSRTSSSSDTSVATASVSTGAAAGTYTFNISQLATASQIRGASNVASPLSTTNDVSALKLSDANFPATVTAGTFTVNGKQITIATDDTLQSVFDKISTATGGTVTGSYDSASDKIVLTSSDEIILGSATDSSNFLQTARLTNNGTGSISSSLALGSVRLTDTLNATHFNTAISDGGSGEGEFKINGVSISFNAGTDSIANVISRINASSAGVTASYDTVNDRFILASKATGDMGIALEDVTGNFLEAAGLTNGTLSRGNNLVYTINDGDPLISQSNTITESSSGISGLSVAVLKEDSSTTVTVGNNTGAIKTAVQDFISAFNKVQSLVDSYTASSTDSSGKVSAGILAGDSDAQSISTSLRRLAYTTLSGLTGSIDHLDDLGIQTNGKDSTISLSDETALNDALANHLADVKDFFSNATSGLAVGMDAYITKTIGDNGTLITHQDNLTKQANAIDDQIEKMERIIAADKARMTASFVAMETAQANINQQLAYLTKTFGS
ncbi:MAG TPA: flagellar filament capping protein FliD [Verrucomicrobiae bacterium]|nr:flagellar filament capping protein FliD [Verrucomicrobiae bacterium]